MKRLALAIAIATSLGLINAVQAEPAVSIHIWSPTDETVITRGTISEGGRETLPSDRFVIGSVAKTFLSVALLQASEQGLVDLDAPISRWITSNVLERFGDTSQLTTRNLLQMRSGLPEYLTDAFYEDWMAGERDTRIVQKALRYAEGPMTFAPGAQFEYANTNYLLAQMVLERATTVGMWKWFQRFIFDPAGMRDTSVMGFGAGRKDLVTGWEDIDEDDRPNPITQYETTKGFGDGGVAATASDISDFYRALLIDKTLLSEASLDQLLAANDGYGLGIAVFGPQGRYIGHEGADIGFAAQAYWDTRENEITVVLVADGDIDPNQVLNELR